LFIASAPRFFAMLGRKVTKQCSERGCYNRPMGHAPTSFQTKREVLRTLVVQGQQTTKIIVDPGLLPADGAGFPPSILERFSQGIPLELDPSMPLELDLDSDPSRVLMTLAFQGTITRCRIPWSSVTFIGVGLPFLGTPWRDDDPKLPDEPGNDGPADESPSGRSHLRVIK